MFIVELSIKSPNDLHAWLEKTISYEGKNKGYLRTPRVFVEDRKGHCWESTNFERTVLQELGIQTAVFYLEDHGCKTTHTTLIYYFKNKVYWFEWAWKKHSGIHAFDTINDAIDVIRNSFLEEYGSIAEFKKSDHPIIQKDDTEMSCITRMRGWSKAEYGKMIEGFQTIRTTKSNVDFFKKKYAGLRSVRVNQETDGYLLIDFTASAVVAVVQCQPSTRYIIALEVSPGYRKRGLAARLLSLAVSDFNCTRLSVNKKNIDAFRLYQKHGWKVWGEDAYMFYMEHEVKKEERSIPVYHHW